LLVILPRRNQVAVDIAYIMLHELILEEVEVRASKVRQKGWVIECTNEDILG
jgi:hypothetical protein